MKYNLVNSRIVILIVLVTQQTYVQPQTDQVELINNETVSTPSCKQNKTSSEKHIKESHNLAEAAAVEAQKAQASQTAASLQISHNVKSELAKKAEAAAKTAQTAYIGKKTIVEEIEDEIERAKKVAQEEYRNLLQERKALELALKIAQQAQVVVILLEKSLKTSEVIARNTKLAVDGIKCEIERKEKLLKAAKGREQQLQKQILPVRQNQSVKYLHM